MSKVAGTVEHADINVGKVVWPKSLERTRTDEQQRNLRALVRDSQSGLILDCSGVEVGNSEIVNLLMRVRNHAKKLNKEVVLYDVPETLSNLIQLCNLTTILRTADNADAAIQQIQVPSQDI